MAALLNIYIGEKIKCPFSVDEIIFCRRSKMIKWGTIRIKTFYLKEIIILTKTENRFHSQKATPNINISSYRCNEKYRSHYQRKLQTFPKEIWIERWVSCFQMEQLNCKVISSSQITVKFNLNLIFSKFSKWSLILSRRIDKKSHKNFGKKKKGSDLLHEKMNDREKSLQKLAI